MATTVLCRCLWVACATSLLLHRSHWDATVEYVWSAMRNSPIVKHDTFEPVLAVAAFLVWNFSFAALDLLFPFHLKKYRIQASDDMSSWQLGDPLDWQRSASALWYLGPLFVFDFIYPRRLLPAAAPSAVQLLLQTLLGLVTYDFLFFWGHLLCHKVPFLYRAVHAKHHSLGVLRACESFRLTPAEVWLDVSCSIAALNIWRCHPMSRALYNLAVTYLITEEHSGYDMPWMLQNVVPGGLWVGSRAHDLHHRTGRCHYQKYLSYLDRALGTAAVVVKGHGGQSAAADSSAVWPCPVPNTSKDQ